MVDHSFQHSDQVRLGKLNRTFTFYSKDDYIPYLWYLVEAVWWISLQRVPDDHYGGQRLFEGFPNDGDQPLGIELSQTRVLALEKQFTDRAKISPNPMIVSDEYHSSETLLQNLEEYKAFLEQPHSQSVKSTYANVIGDIEDQLYERDRWLREHRKNLDVELTKLFVPLYEGRLRATGFKIRGSSVDEAKAHIRQHSLLFSTMKRVPISPDEWSLEGMSWDDCILQTDHHLYAGVAITRDELLSVFPPKCKPLKSGGMCDEYIVTSANHRIEFVEEEDSSSRTGRPTKDWDAFYLELSKRLIENSLPAKQSAAAYEFRIWFKDTLGEKVGLSTISEKLKPFYQEFIRRPK